jgi:hypothetical protein
MWVEMDPDVSPVNYRHVISGGEMSVVAERCERWCRAHGRSSLTLSPGVPDFVFDIFWGAFTQAAKRFRSERGLAGIGCR